MSKYTFRCKGVVLAPIIASSSDDAHNKLTEEHSWIGANRNNSTLVRVESVGDLEPSHPDVLGCMTSNY